MALWNFFIVLVLVACTVILNWHMIRIIFPINCDCYGKEKKKTSIRSYVMSEQRNIIEMRGQVCVWSLNKGVRNKNKWHVEMFHEYVGTCI